MINANNYVNIQGWMVTDLNLKGNNLLVYAIIYSFSQDGESRFSGGLQYLADWCNCTKQGIQKNLKNLLELGLIEKFDKEVNGIKYCEYSCIVCNKVVYPMQQSCISNKTNNTYKENSSTKVLLQENGKSENAFLGSVSKTTDDKPKKKNLFEKCLDVIDEYTEDGELKELLVTYLKYRLEIKDKPLYANMWKGMINKLRQLDGGDYDTACAIVQQSINRGYLGFFSVNVYTGYNKSNNNLHNKINESGAVNVPHITDEEKDEIERMIEMGEIHEY